MRAHPGKYHLLLRSKTSQVLSISETIINSSTAETSLGIITESGLNVENYLNCIINKVSRKVNALGRVINN